ncbi:unnamed protein product [Soboliphyme baturini]|uniref:HMG box domain-containing protein n=1 Tax=Soboliphyme baturini TaxID=241478 RepID=A0A183IJN5_9BILA|nr:unnamed protein product [Soboliphyme baturini]
MRSYNFPDSPPFSGYSLFCKQRLQKIAVTGMDKEERLVELRNCSVKWHELTGVEQDQFREQAAEMKRNYSISIITWLKDMESKNMHKVIARMFEMIRLLPRYVQLIRTSVLLHRKCMQKVYKCPEVETRSGFSLFCQSRAKNKFQVQSEPQPVTETEPTTSDESLDVKRRVAIQKYLTEWRNSPNQIRAKFYSEALQRRQQTTKDYQLWLESMQEQNMSSVLEIFLKQDALLSMLKLDYPKKLPKKQDQPSADQ